MAMKYKEVGGGQATGLADSFVNFLQQGLQTGSFGGAGAVSQFGGANPIGSTTGIAGVLNDLLAGGAGKIGGALSTQIKQQEGDDVAALRARFGAGGGGAFGTGAGFAEATYRAREAPQLATAIGGLQEGALSQLLPLFMGVFNKGTAQREGTFQPNTALSAAQIGLPLAGSALGFLAGGPGGAAIGSQFGSSLSGDLSGLSGMPSQPPTLDPSTFASMMPSFAARF